MEKLQRGVPNGYQTHRIIDQLSNDRIWSNSRAFQEPSFLIFLTCSYRLNTCISDVSTPAMTLTPCSPPCYSVKTFVIFSMQIGKFLPHLQVITKAYKHCHCSRRRRCHKCIHTYRSASLLHSAIFLCSQ